MKELKGKVAVITGGGSGIGQAVALELAGKGCNLALVDISEKGLKETARQARKHKVRVSTHVADVTSKAAMRALPDAVIATHKTVHILFNNAGITIEKPFAEQSMKELEKIVGINLWGVIYGCKYFLPHLQEASEAHIVNTSSMAGLLGLPTQSGYSATKAAVKALSESLYAELAPENIGVTCVMPGAIRTNIFSTAIEHSSDPEATRKLADTVNRFAMAPEDAAVKIVRAIQRNDMHLTIGTDARFIDFLKRQYPEAIHRMIALGMKARSRLAA